MFGIYGISHGSMVSLVMYIGVDGIPQGLIGSPGMICGVLGNSLNFRRLCCIV